MSGDVAAEVAAVLGDHLWNGCTEPACDPGSDPEVCVDRPFLNHLSETLAEALAPLIAAAEQRGREDNADHGTCYPYGSKALAALLDEVRAAALQEAADKWQWGEWTVLTAPIKAADQPQRIIGAAQAVTDWLRECADRIGGGA